MSTGYDKALEALKRGETIKLQRWKRQGVDQNGRPVQGFETFALFEPRAHVEGEESPRSSRLVLDKEGDELSKLPNVIDERDAGETVEP